MTGMKWTHRSLRKLCKALRRRGVRLSPTTLARLLRRLRFSLRTCRKQKAGIRNRDRDRQFRYLLRLRNWYLARNWPVISVDGKKKELVGNFKNPGRSWRRRPHQVLDHDFPSWAKGRANPVGIYDLAHNDGYVVIGISHETPSFEVAAIRRWWLDVPWQLKNNYALTIPKGALADVAEQQNDSIAVNYTGVDPEKFATFIVNVVGKSDEASYIVQLLNESGKLLQEKTGVHSGVCRFNYVPAGNVKFRIIEDMNDNGRWDTGNLVERRQPERAEYYMDDKNIDTFAAKENWEVELTIDMNKVFAPVTMQSLAELLEKREALRLQKVLEERAKNPRRNTNSNTSNTTSTMGGGFNSGMNTMMNGLR